MCVYIGVITTYVRRPFPYYSFKPQMAQLYSSQFSITAIASCLAQWVTIVGRLQRVLPFVLAHHHAHSCTHSHSLTHSHTHTHTHTHAHFRIVSSVPLESDLPPDVPLGAPVLAQALPSLQPLPRPRGETN